jgi:hypothetical protein
MVNGIFLLPRNWEKVAGQTWSTRPYCRASKRSPNPQTIEMLFTSGVARLSL